MIELYIDGASAGNPGLSGAGVFIKNGKDSRQLSVPLPIMENHEAEFNALIIGLEKCLPYKDHIISCRTDSQIVFHAVENRRVKNSTYAAYLTNALEMIDQFPLFFIKWIPSKENSVADRLARQAIRSQQA
ncbi:reverse transcriptase-like protein [Jeotgalibacillus sp. R-1-5s-1]|uniref:reverse transcriptase-like protein n=1 Tax=Jeotgalibacillus sp. R-1-5s-1 TaxID=2555897 RepID=UPI00106C36AF|nr:reverse transcriptase-like protein [Jeotgalibacillus sp. R-1-5s-1]TFE03258.1 reverse transcriptase-like protein [Jeotgalibacillus sp. R-1-5s-1]